MSIEIEVLNGDASWTQVQPLFHTIWPPDVVATLPWAGITFAHADLRVLVLDEAGDVVSHVGLYRRIITWNGQKMNAAGIGGVLTRTDQRNRGLATIALNAAIQTLRAEDSVNFAILFCEPYRAPFIWRAASIRLRDRSMSSSPIRAACDSRRSHPMCTT